MKFKTKGSMILISILCILILSIGIVSATEDINTNINNATGDIDTDINNDYQSDSIDIDAAIDANNGNNEQTDNIADINDYNELDKSKDKLNDDGDDSVENDPEEPEDPEDNFDEEVYLSYELSKPENGESYVEGEEITITYHLENAVGEDASGDYEVNIFCLDDESIDTYTPFSINGTSQFTITDYYPVGNYIAYIGKYVQEEGSDELFFGIMEDLMWNDGFEDAPDFTIKTNYNKEVYAPITIGYSIVEIENLTEGDSITGGIRLSDEFGNKLNDKVYIAIYKYDENEGEFVEANHNEPTASNGMAGFKFENLEAGDYYIAVDNIYHTDEFDDEKRYNNIISEQINFTVKENIDPNDYKISLDSESSIITTDSSYTIGIQILDPYNKTYEGAVELYSNETKIADLDISYDDGEDYFHYNLSGLTIGINEYTLIYKINDEFNASSSIQIIRYGANLELSRADNETVLVTLSDLNSEPIANTPLQISLNGEVSTIITDENGTYTIPISGNSSIKVTYVDSISKEILISAMDIIYETEIIEKNNTIVVNNTVEIPVNVTVEVPVEVPANASLSLSTEDGKTVIVKLTDIDGNAISEGKIKLTINGAESNMTLGTDGTAKIFVEGNNTITASYTTEQNNTVFSSINLIVINNEMIKEINNTIVLNNTKVRGETKIDYKDMNTVAVNVASDGRVGEYFNVTLKDGKGNVLANKPVQIGFNGKIYNKTTDAKGIAQLQINLAREDLYTFAVAFLGDDDYNASFVVAKINVTKQSPRITTANKSYKTSAKSKTLSATLKTALGNPVKGKKVTFTVNGKSYTASTNSKGIASVNVSLSKKGTYSFTVKYDGDSTFKATSQTGKLTIK